MIKKCALRLINACRGKTGRDKLQQLVCMICLLFALAPVNGQAQPHIVQGRVVDQEGKPQPGATVTVVRTNAGASTDQDGRFTIAAVEGDSIIVSGVNFRQSSFIVTRQASYTISVELKNTELSDVVVIGYGTAKRREVTGAVSVVDVSKQKDIPIANVSRLLVGQAPGVQVTQNSGRPGDELKVTIRGIGSLGAGSDPLYVVDGFPVGSSVGQNINPADIQSITILKDAVSTAIYGARASNGVVLITTKAAKAGKVAISFNASYGIQDIPDSRKVKVLDGEGFAQFKKDIFMDRIRYFENREPAISEVPEDYRYPEQTAHSTNWYNAILNRNAAFQHYNIQLSQGSGNIRTLVSLGYREQQGVLIKTGYKNYSVRANIGGKINDFMEMGITINGSYARQQLAPGTEGRSSLLGSTLLMDPRQPIYKEDGSYNNYIKGDGTFGWGNPVQGLNEIKTTLGTGSLLSNGFLEFTLLKGLTFRTAVNVKLDHQTYKQFVPSGISGQNAPAPQNASLSEYANNSINYSTDQLLTYSKTLDNHSFSLMAGYNAQEETIKGLSGNGNTFSSDQTPYFSAAAVKEVNSAESSWSAVAWFGRLIYSFQDKYLLTGTFRREGNSRFGADNKYGNFPAVSAGWRVSQEKFLSGISWLHELKLRGSWGITGNSNIGSYPGSAYMNPGGYTLGGSYVSGQVVSSFANSRLKWERSNQSDIGLDLLVLNGKISFSFDYYKRITTDMLLPVQLPAISGFTTTFTNIGKVQNTGLEFVAGYKTAVTKDINIFANGNISFNRNKVLEIRGENDQLLSGEFYSGYNISRVGRPIGMLYGFQVLKIFNTQEEIDKAPRQDGVIPGVYQYLDADSNGEISYDTKDMVEIGNPTPKFIWGLTLGGSYRAFDLSVLLTGAQGFEIYRNIETSTMNMDGIFNVLEESRQRWRSADNPGNGRYATSNTWKWARETNSRYVYSGSHAWVKNISLGYSLPAAAVKNGSLRVFVSADNVFLLTRFPGNNPDINNRGGINPGQDEESYPVARTFSIGANLTF
ncbi:MAG: TonB-dependent receptor [Candidatus Pseudobacter hemicellulosilyticus]|uniref:TonB-dependent receptor n=1 Tax=Candidatus Pseudobacter hemicellulosilyticus TaxID=3121375 RepID=A0AAJ5WRI8_9BACT|nr:MAG: TonB-dependent receptor [Pseudobacter sp.]